MLKKVPCYILLIAMLGVCLSAGGEVASGFVLADETFYGMENDFRQKAFDRSMNSVHISDGQNFLFVPELDGHLLPNLFVIEQNGMVLTENGKDIQQIVSVILETAQTIQESFPDTFVYNTQKVAAEATGEVLFSVAENDLWLWSQDHQAVMLPVYFTDATADEMLDGVYLLTAVSSDERNSYYALYNDPQFVGAYLSHIEVNAEKSDFQRAISHWYLKSLANGTLGEEASAAETLEPTAVPTTEPTLAVTVTAEPIAAATPTPAPAYTQEPATVTPTQPPTPTPTMEPTATPTVTPTFTPGAQAEVSTWKPNLTITTAPNLDFVLGIQLEENEENQANEVTPPPGDGSFIGIVRIVRERAYVRALPDETTKALTVVREGEELPVLSVSEKGWYEIEPSNGKIGFIHPNTAEYTPYH